MTAVLRLETEGEWTCPVCGFGSAFSVPRNYDTCARCGWIDDPSDFEDPERRSDVNDDSLTGARATWPERLIAQLTIAPQSTFAVVERSGSIGGLEFVIDGRPLGEMFPTGLRAAIGEWLFRDLAGALADGVAATPTGRCRLYVCTQCGGDDYEVSLSADVRVLNDRVIWSRIGIEAYDLENGVWSIDLRRDPAGFAFDAGEYRRALSGIRSKG